MRIFITLSIALLSFNLSAQTPSFHISFSCTTTVENGFTPAKLEVISHAGQFKITEHSESGKIQSFLLLGDVLGSVNQFTFFGTEVALTGPMPEAKVDLSTNSELGINVGEREIAGVSCISCGGGDWCAPSLGESPSGWPGSSMPLETTIEYGETSYNIVATSIKILSAKDFRRGGPYSNTFAIDQGRKVVDARGFVELFQLTPPTDVIRY